MGKYSTVKKESQFKNFVFDDYFQQKNVGYETEIGNIDFIVTDKKSRNKKDGEGAKVHYAWFESKKGIADKYSMITQLILTAKKVYDKNDFIPNYIGCFDTQNICFIELVNILPIYKDNDVNWTITPSNHESEDFIKIKNKLKKLIENNIVVFEFEKDDIEIKSFINENVIRGNTGAKFLINKNNFLNIFYKWCEAVMPTIDIDLSKFNKAGIIEGDFYLADLISNDNRTLREGLNIVLHYYHYKFQQGVEKNLGISLFAEISFKDGQKAFHQFWEKYERPPLEEYWEYIILRHDLLVPQDKRQREGKFFTPKEWVMLSQEYLEKVFGVNWQEEYYVWDCAAGTGNLLNGLTNKYNIWASDIDKSNVDIMKDIASRKNTLLDNHIFKFDFLNDKFTDLPKELRNILEDDEKRKKLIVYINPPYAEAPSTIQKTGKGKNKTGVSNNYETYGTYIEFVGKAINELFVQFICRIYNEMKDCKIGMFSKLKYVNSQNFIKFREFFKSKFLKGFICPSFTFDNVSGNFPIAFTVWNNEVKHKIKEIKLDVYDIDKNKEVISCGKKRIKPFEKGEYLTDWIRHYYDKSGECIGTLRYMTPDFQNNSNNYITNNPKESDIKKCIVTNITKNNIEEIMIYLGIRQCIEYKWINDRDQYLFPNDEYKNDIEFRNNCFIYILFHGQNKVTGSIAKKINHWIPFTEKEVNAKEKFESNFMSEYLAGKITKDEEVDLFNENEKKVKKPMKLSKEALEVFNAGKQLWVYYHQQKRINVNASLYDIKGYFQGFSNDRMNNKSNDEKYNLLIDDLRKKMKNLAKAIEPKVYEYGFLLK